MIHLIKSWGIYNLKKYLFYYCMSIFRSLGLVHWTSVNYKMLELQLNFCLSQWGKFSCHLYFLCKLYNDSKTNIQSKKFINTKFSFIDMTSPNPLSINQPRPEECLLPWGVRRSWFLLFFPSYHLHQASCYLWPFRRWMGEEKEREAHSKKDLLELVINTVVSRRHTLQE